MERLRTPGTTYRTPGRSIVVRLSGGTLGVILLLGLAWILVHADLGQARSAADRTVATVDALTVDILTVSKLRDDEETGVRGYLLTDDRVFLQPYTSARRALPALGRRIAAYLPDEPVIGPLVANERRRAAAWDAWAVAVMHGPAYGRGAAVLDAQQRVGKKLFDADRRSITAIVGALDAERAEQLARESQLFAGIDQGLGGFFALAIALGLLLGWLSLRALMQPLNTLGRAARAIGGGDLSHPVPATDAPEFTRLAQDMEAMRRALAAQRETLEASEARLRALVTNLPVILYALDADGIFTLCDGQALAPLGIAPDTVVGRSYRDVHARQPRTVEQLRRALAGEPISFLHTLAGFTFEARVTPLRDAAGQVTGVIGVSADITARVQAETALQAEADRRAAIIATQHDIARAALDLDGVITLVAERAKELTGAEGAVVELVEGAEMVYRGVSGTATPHRGLRLNSAGSLSGLCVQTGQVLRCDDTETDARVDRAACRRIGARSMLVVPLLQELRAVGVLKVYSSRVHAFDTGDVETLQLMAGLLAAALDHALAFEARRALLAERTYLAQHDPLTGLPNRALLRDRLGQALAQARRRGSQVALLFLDLNGFKGINDMLGHDAGDRLLVETAARLRRCVREEDTAARLGGDEFTVVLPNVASASDGAVVAERLAQALAEPIPYAGRHLRVTASIGIALAPRDGDDVDTLLKSADTAMYAAKRKSKETGREALVASASAHQAGEGSACTTASAGPL